MHRSTALCLLLVRAAIAFPLHAALWRTARTVAPLMMSYAQKLETLNEVEATRELEMLLKQPRFRASALPHELELLERELANRLAAVARANDKVNVGPAADEIKALLGPKPEVQQQQPGPMAIGDERAVAVEYEYGRDPRFAPPWIANNTELLAELKASSTAKPKSAAESKSAAVTSVQTLADFEAAMARAQATNKLLVVKYYAPWCRACLAIKPNFERVANAYVSGADFIECDAGASRVLFALADVRKMPVVHIYKDGMLQQTREIGNKEKLASLEENLALVAEGFGA